MAGVTAPGSAIDGKRNAQIRADVCDGLIQFLKGNIQGPALRTSRLFVLPDAGYIEILGDRLALDFFRSGSVF